MHSSDIRELYKKSVQERIALIAEFSNLNAEEIKLLQNTGSLESGIGDKLIENFVTAIEMPMGIATNFLVNGKDYLIPMAIEEPSVVAACSNAAKIARKSGGFRASSTESVMIGQIQLTEISNVEIAMKSIKQEEKQILLLANSVSKTLRELKKGAIDIEVRKIENLKNTIIVHLIVDVGSAMGANIINSMCEITAPLLEEITGGESVLRILSNLSPGRISHAEAVFGADVIGGSRVVKRIAKASEMAKNDIFRAVTNNKGIMNGIDAVLIATMNDWRQAEANAHAYASISGSYTSLTSFTENDDGNIIGKINIPIAIGTVGGTTSTIPKAVLSRKILGVENTKEFQSLLAAVGLAQNFAAVRALSDEGIQKGHMALHSRNLAIAAGAKGEEIDKISELLKKEGKISMTRAREILELIRNNSEVK
ncbi:MAG: hydroxymethylglutaryl-CoA reductase, degradative [Thermoplasmataceae archaeon]